MWSVEQVEISPVELDFSSSDQGRCAATAVHAAGVCLFNAIERIDVEPRATQVEICAGCGYPHCEPGGWVTFRRIGRRVAWLPAWREMEAGEWQSTEYRPPSFLSTKGVPFFGEDAWDRLRALNPRLPPARDIARLDSREAARLAQWEAPARVLGTFPAEPRLRRELVLAATVGDAAAEALAVDRFLQDLRAAAGPMTEVPQEATVVPVEFWLDARGTPGWKAFGRVGDELCLVLEDGTALVRAAD